jgi:two-component system C4-dicarboxylate transport sensor histidine kinase DctB
LAIANSSAVPADFDALAAANRLAVYGQVARWLVHDLRNPTQALALITELMGENPAGGDGAAVDTVREATAQLARSLKLLDRLLRLPRPIAESASLSLVDSLEFVAALHRSHRSGVRLELPAGSLPAVCGTTHDVEQILLNLLLNSLDAMGAQAGGRLAVRTAVVGTEVQMSVADNGPGIAPEQRARLFEAAPMMQEGRLRGLGLAVSRGLARRYGGDLVHSAVDAPGARFELRLPLWRRE